MGRGHCPSGCAGAELEPVDLADVACDGFVTEPLETGVVKVAPSGRWIGFVVLAVAVSFRSVSIRVA